MSVESIKYCMGVYLGRDPQKNIQKEVVDHGAGEMNGKKLIGKPLKNLQRSGMA